ncbi:MAG: ATP-dependent Clp protease proteolytic subunit [Thermoflexales bacterium]|nr:ATP-dependent Clp protease proteolytic subunit [Thermoflexales bacterium]MCS7323865.1 ATP-dependent Clp protease proteolytic subunit [Thermoflexales bacterium]MDW8052979.1 ATP-dependent Clp protease proteolytic subunit [Anaerolineae bacterium]MDW8291632.1 ATP-dependent Clp protease proteolytic subunit [Anaerolineae bacterium]
MTSEIYVRFFAPVIPQTVNALLQVLDQAVQHGVERVHLLLSSPGGSVFHGLSVYNWLRGAPFQTYTYNFGSVDSIGVVLFCSGAQRFSVPHARFLLHPVQFNVQGNAQFSESQLEEHLKGLRADQENIARVVADTVGKPLAEVMHDMHQRLALNPDQARAYGLVHEIKSLLLPPSATLFTINEPLNLSNPFMPAQPA